jgi:hypothetical protein
MTDKASKPAPVAEEPSAPTPESLSPLERIKLYREGIRKETEGVKLQLSECLNKAIDIVKQLQDFGVTDILKDPMYQDFMALWGGKKAPSQPRATTAKKVTQTKPGKKLSAVEAVQELLKDGKQRSRKEILAALSDFSKGNINSALVKLKKKKIIKSVGRGMYQLAK